MNMNHLQFGEEMLDTLDLDPVYVMLVQADLDPTLLKRWVFSYWFFYHSGVSSLLAESKDYYSSALYALSGPRGTERRHFRGALGQNTLTELALFKEPEEIVDWVSAVPTFTEIKRRMESLPGCGPWIAFKAADMIDRCLGIPVDWTGCSMATYRDPIKGAALITKGDRDAPMSKEETVAAYAVMVEQFKHRLAPPFFDRPVGLPEVETIACKFKSHHKGHYPVGKDKKEMLKQLADYPHSPLAGSLLTVTTDGVIW